MKMIFRMKKMTNRCVQELFRIVPELPRVAQSCPELLRVAITQTEKTGGPNGLTNQRTDGRTLPLIEMLGASKNIYITGGPKKGSSLFL